jgi:hypothetical protein
MQKVRLIAEYRLPASGGSIRIVDLIENLAGAPTTVQMLYHVNFGPPYCGPGSRVALPVAQVAPRNPHAAKDIGHWDVYPPAVAGFEEQVYFFEAAADPAGKTLAVLQSPDKKRGVCLRWSKRELGCFTLWKNPEAEADGYVTGLEPGTNFPNPRSFEARRGRHVELAPGARHRMELELQALVGPEAVEAALAQVGKFRLPPTIHAGPIEAWSPPEKK